MSESPSWEIRYSKSRSSPYFYDHASKTSTWEAPPSLSKAELLALPGAHYLTSPPATDSAPTKVRASHLLIKHRDSRRPSSWKEPNVTRTKEEARVILKGHRSALYEAEQKGELSEAFQKLAGTESDCSSANKGGDLGWFGRQQMQKPFEDATFATAVGQMSDLIETESGVHIIFRTG